MWAYAFVLIFSSIDINKLELCLDVRQNSMVELFLGSTSSGTRKGIAESGVCSLQ